MTIIAVARIYNDQRGETGAIVSWTAIHEPDTRSDHRGGIAILARLEARYGNGPFSITYVNPADDPRRQTLGVK